MMRRAFTRTLHVSRPLGQLSVTFFTKETCQLCKNAAQVLDKALALSEISPERVLRVDIMKPENSSAFDKYCFDVPVLHVDRPGEKVVKFMHYFDEAELVAAFKKG